MEYFIKGISHFFNLFADFFEYCENIIYLIFIFIIILLMISALKKIKDFKWTLLKALKAYLSLYKCLMYSMLIIILFITTIYTYKINNQFKILSILVLLINFIKESTKVYDFKVLDGNNETILKFKDFKNIFLTNLTLIFFKITYWGELYVINVVEIKNYLVSMLIIIIIEIFVMLAFKMQLLYEVSFSFVNSKSNYNKLFKVIDFIKIFVICKNNTNYFRIVRIYLEKEIINKVNHKEIVNFCLYYKSIKDKVKQSNNYESNYNICLDFISVDKRLGGQIIDEC